MSDMHTFRFTAGALTGDEFAFWARTPEEANAAACAWVASEPALAGAAWEWVPPAAPPETLPQENARWTLCRESLGREPRTWEFMAWVARRWQEYAQAQGAKDSSELRARVGPAVHPAFDAWLSTAGARP